MAYRLLIIGERATAEGLSALLAGAGYEDVRVVNDALKALELVGTYAPDAVLLDADLPGTSAASLVTRIIGVRPTPVVVHASFDRIEDVREADDLGAAAYVFRPLSRENLLGAVELAMSRFRQCQALRIELGDCRETLRIRKLVERAKGILMKRGPMSEEDAFLRIQKMARSNNIPMEKVAQSIITASELL